MQSVVNLINRLINIQIFASYFAILHNYLTLTAESQDKYAQKMKRLLAALRETW